MCLLPFFPLGFTTRGALSPIPHSLLSHMLLGVGCLPLVAPSCQAASVLEAEQSVLGTDSRSLGQQTAVRTTAHEHFSELPALRAMRQTGDIQKTWLCFGCNTRDTKCPTAFTLPVAHILCPVRISLVFLPSLENTFKGDLTLLVPDPSPRRNSLEVAEVSPTDSSQCCFNNSQGYTISNTIFLLNCVINIFVATLLILLCRWAVSTILNFAWFSGIIIKDKTEKHRLSASFG